MKLNHYVAAFGIMAILSTSALAAETTNWEIDSIHSGIYFTVRHLGILDVRGSFTKVRGTVAMNDDDLNQSKVNATVDINSISTGAEPRDKHLLSADFFDVEKFPTMSFQSTKVSKSGNGLKMTGNLTLHGVTREVTFDVKQPSAPINILKATRRGISATTKINRKDFGMAFDDTVGLEVAIDLEMDVVKAGSGAEGGK